VTIGVVAGVLIAAGATRSVLYEVAASDPGTYLSVAAVVGGVVAGLAAYLPGRRAATSEVNSLLRHN
jgi:hypothetical protein